MATDEGQPVGRRAEPGEPVSPFLSLLPAANQTSTTRSRRGPEQVSTLTWPSITHSRRQRRLAWRDCSSFRTASVGRGASGLLGEPDVGRRDDAEAPHRLPQIIRGKELLGASDVVRLQDDGHVVRIVSTPVEPGVHEAVLATCALVLVEAWLPDVVVRDCMTDEDRAHGAPPVCLSRVRLTRSSDTTRPPPALPGLPCERTPAVPDSVPAALLGVG